MKKLILVLGLMLICANGWCVAADMYIKPVATGTEDGLSWANAWGISEFIIDVEASAEAGDRYFFLGGQTFTSDQDLNTALSGTSLDPIWLIGVATGTTAEPPVFSDWAVGTDRPLLDFQTNDDTLVFQNFYMVFNLQAHMADIGGWSVDQNSIFWNCYSKKFDNGRFGYVLGNSSSVSNCEADGTEGGGGVDTNSNSVISFCYIHDTGTGIQLDGIGSAAFGNILDTCTTGMTGGGRNHTIASNTFFNCTTGISDGGPPASIYVNNIIDTSTTGVSFTNANKIVWLDYNAWGNNTDDVSNATQGPNAQISVATYLANGGTEDFTLSSGGDPLDAGLQFEGIVSQGTLDGDYKWNIGVDQDDNTAAGGGSAGHVLIF